MIFFFWIAFLFVIYTYAGYPLAILIASRARKSAEKAEPTEWPAVTIIVPFCNESQRVSEKLKTLRALNYRGDIQIILVSDGEEDETAEIVRGSQSADVHPVVLPVRSGKPAALNAAMNVVKHDLVLFTDARQMLDKDALRSLVCSMQCQQASALNGDRIQKIGAVSGELVFLEGEGAAGNDDNGNDEANVGLYWRYEKMIRSAESRYASVPGVTGALYLIKRKYIQPLSEDALLDDFEIPLAALRAGERVILDSDARVFDRAAESVEKEKARKIRTLTGNYQAFLRHRWLFSPTQNPIWWQFISHKVFRLLVPYCLLALFIIPLLDLHGFYAVFWLLQTVFYALALGNIYSVKGCRRGPAAIARLFVELNLAAVIGAYRYFSGRVDAKWERTV